MKVSNKNVYHDHLKKLKYSCDKISQKVGPRHDP